MIKSISLKALLAGLAATAIAGGAVAQSTPPEPAAKDPAVGAGQRSTQQTPMGTTGTPTNRSAAGGMSADTAAGSTTTTSPGAAGSSGSSATMGATGSSASGTTGSMDTSTTRSTTTARTARADRN